MRVIGHRGASGHAPENTLASMRKAAELGISWVEFDVRLCRDGALVVFHDAELARTTNGIGKVAETNLVDLQSLDAGAWFSKEFKGEFVPTLRQTIDQLSRFGLGANIEIKQGIETAQITVRCLADKWPNTLPPPLISSFIEDALEAAAKTAPEIPRALNVEGIPKDWHRRLKNLRCTALHCQAKTLTPKQAQAVTEAGYDLRCYTVNDQAQANELFEMGVMAVFSDFPERIRQE